ncbi:MAG: AraC family transcriptional regulator [Candidatus Limivivens sp.]|nr:AraC family transcriptional regulator [Candidatus Limivivens sp.]
MNRKEHFLNDYNEEDHYAALNKQNVYVSHSGDYKENPIYHVHNSCELLFIEEGEGDYRIGNTYYEIGPNDVLIIGGTDPHSRKFKKTPCLRYGLTVMPSFMQSLPIINGYMNVYRTQSPEDAQKLRHIDPAIFQRMIQILWQLRDETKENGKGRGDLVYALLLELTIYLKRILRLEKQDVSGTYKLMSDVKNYIDFHYAEDLSLNELSKQFYLQPNTISKNFGKTFGKNVNSYINSVRVTHAVRILEENEISITELSALVGYTSVNTFLRQFREKMGVSPLQYKKRFEQYMAVNDTQHLF